MVRIAPSILSADLGNLAGAVRSAAQGGADFIHVDVMDGCFVPNITFGPGTVKTLKAATTVPLDVHLMIADPDRYLADFATAGARVITVHAEACTHLHRTLQLIRELGALAGVAYNPATPLSSLPYVAELADLVLIMSVNPGFGGQRFIGSALDKIRVASRIMAESGHQAEIEVDGGIGTANAGAVTAAGATVLVAGTAVYGAPDVGTAIAAIRSAAHSRQA